ncbi:hypothetical protein [Planktothrix agardhii]|jgi:hypothetical protein|uniref:hypothetical protein n=1 Tax=Planktothrix agardhii TaxID=1160 RepID=UPI0020B347C7|nr:hypothetical protein [Planktothrix agardhii]CAD5985211.1 hypothetical protein PCC7811_04541 [Planktothrix agardhii]CAD5985330.1 hypothetical protein PCC7811_04555 [Planktothrix agardhii]
MILPTSEQKDLSLDDYDLLSKINHDFNKEYVLSIYADIDGYSILVLGRVRDENNRNYIIYYSQQKAKLYAQKLLDELIYLKQYFKSFLNVYCVNNSVLKILIDKNIGKNKYNAIDFKLEDIPNYLLSIELLIGLDKLRIHPLAKGLGMDYQEFNINIKSYSIYALMLPFVEYNERSINYWFGYSVALDRELIKDYQQNYRGY